MNLLNGRLSAGQYRYFFLDIPFVDPKRGNVSPIENFHLYVGYYFWISSFVVLLLGEFMLAVIHKNSTIIRL